MAFANKELLGGIIDGKDNLFNKGSCFSCFPGRARRLWGDTPDPGAGDTGQGAAAPAVPLSAAALSEGF